MIRPKCLRQRAQRSQKSDESLMWPCRVAPAPPTLLPLDGEGFVSAEMPPVAHTRSFFHILKLWKHDADTEKGLPFSSRFRHQLVASVVLWLSGRKKFMFHPPFTPSAL